MTNPDDKEKMVGDVGDGVCEGRAMPFDVAVVMPVYNERECIEGVLRSWLEVLEGTGADFLMIVLNDDSTDGTEEILARFEDNPHCRIVNKPNSGHGPTILKGYALAVQLAEWVFQCDSDDEMEARHFVELWARRDDYDALFGVRRGRTQNVTRALVSAVSRLTVRVLFGSGVTDVNTPFRLIRAHLLGRIVEQIPLDTFAPNVIISGALAKGGARICNVPVPHRGRRTGTVSIVKWKLIKSACLAFAQTLRCHPTMAARSAHSA